MTNLLFFVLLLFLFPNPTTIILEHINWQSNLLQTSYVCFLVNLQTERRQK